MHRKGVHVCMGHMRGRQPAQSVAERPGPPRCWAPAAPAQTRPRPGREGPTRAAGAEARVTKGITGLRHQRLVGPSKVRTSGVCGSMQCV